VFGFGLPRRRTPPAPAVGAVFGQLSDHRVDQRHGDAWAVYTGRITRRPLVYGDRDKLGGMLTIHTHSHPTRAVLIVALRGPHRAEIDSARHRSPA
jgi:hypothetical protein